MAEQSFLETVLRRSLGAIAPQAAFMAEALPKAKSFARNVTTKRKDVPLQADPNRDILTTTTVQDAAGNSYFLPEGVDTLPLLLDVKQM